MSEPSRAERYRWHADAFLTSLGAAGAEAEPAGDAEDVFRSRVDRGRVAVRVSELAREGRDEPAVREPVRAYRKAIARAARERWLARDGAAPLEVWIGFGEYEQSTAGRDRNRIGRRLCELVRAGLPAEGRFASLQPSTERETSFPLGLSSITVARLPTYTDAYWRVKPATEPPTLDAGALRAAVGAPDGIEGDRCHRLLVVGEVDVLRADLADGAADEVETGGFDAVHLLDAGAGDLRTLARGGER